MLAVENVGVEAFGVDHKVDVREGKLVVREYGEEAFIGVVRPLGHDLDRNFVALGGSAGRTDEFHRGCLADNPCAVPGSVGVVASYLHGEGGADIELRVVGRGGVEYGALGH